jgi:hypothetical protein
MERFVIQSFTPVPGKDRWQLDELTDEQAGHLGISIEGRFKAKHYRYQDTA